MSNSLLNGLKETTNLGYTTNGAVSRLHTTSKVYDLFALGSAYRQRSEEDVMFLFKQAYEEDADLAMKCLFYIRDILEGQGERRFFRVCLKWLANTHPESVKKNLDNITEFGRWDDLYALDGTKCEDAAYKKFAGQLFADSAADYPSLAAKWAKSENTSSAESRRLAVKTRSYTGLTSREYRKLLSSLRERLNVLERLMSAGKWDEIDFAKIPSKAGLQYRQAFMRHDVQRPEGKTYAEFMKSENTTVNAKALYPYEVVHKALDLAEYFTWNQKTLALDNVERLAINKYWDNLTDYFKDKTFNGLCMIDTSGSMTMTCENNIRPLDVSLSLGAYCAERAAGPFKGYFMTFESSPHLVEFEGLDFVGKISRAAKSPWSGSTNIEAAFNLLLDTLIKNNCSQEDVPQNLMIVSDMQFDTATGIWKTPGKQSTLMENIAAKWEEAGYIMPHLVFWNVNAIGSANIPMKEQDGITFVSGASPVIFDMIMSGKTGQDLMNEKLRSERYKSIVA